MMAQSSTPTGVNRYIIMTKIVKPATQGATRLEEVPLLWPVRLQEQMAAINWRIPRCIRSFQPPYLCRRCTESCLLGQRDSFPAFSIFPFLADLAPLGPRQSLSWLHQDQRSKRQPSAYACISCGS